MPGVPGFSLNPPPQGGQGPYGAVPGAVGLPPVYQDLGNVYPNLTGTNAQVSQNILGELAGQLSPETMNSIQDEAARFGVTSGMPGSALSGQRGLKNLGLSVEGLQHQGLQDYNALIPTISRTQTVDPHLQTDIASRNALFGSAPDPAAAAAAAEAAFRRGLGTGRTLGGGGGGVITQTPPNLSAPMPRSGGGVTETPSGGGAFYGTRGGPPAAGADNWTAGPNWTDAPTTGYGGGDVFGSGGRSPEDAAWNSPASPGAPTTAYAGLGGDPGVQSYQDLLNWFGLDNTPSPDIYNVNDPLGFGDQGMGDLVGAGDEGG